MHTVRTGSSSPGGSPLVLVPGVGADTETWRPVLTGLAAQREVVRLDLPGFGRTPPFDGEVTMARYADALEAHLRAEGLASADLVGSSMGARLVMELARRGVGRASVALDPGGFWSAGQKKVFGATLAASVALVRALRPALPVLLSTPVGRTDYALSEVRGLADAPGTSPAITALSTGPDQVGAPAGSLPGPMLVVWGRQDRVTIPRPEWVGELFPDATVELWDSCGHFPHWDQPERTVSRVLSFTGGG